MLIKNSGCHAFRKLDFHDRSPPWKLPAQTLRNPTPVPAQLFRKHQPVQPRMMIRRRDDVDEPFLCILIDPSWPPLTR